MPSAGDHALAELRDRLLAAGNIAPLAAKRTAPLLEQVVKNQVAGGKGPDGKPWPEKKTGGRALKNAAAAISVNANGPTVVVTLSGPEVYHHHGTGRLPKREILPESGELPKAYVDACREGAAQAFAETMGLR